MRTLKWVLAIIIGLPIIAIVAVVAFVVTLDPNKLKPMIVDAAKEQGIRVEMVGDLSWQFYPNIGLKINDLSLFNAADSSELATLKSASFSVAFKPLLQRKIDVVGINVSGADINYWVDAKGNSQWPVSDTKTPPASPASTTADAPTLNIQSLVLDDAALNYRDATQNVTLSGLGVRATGVNIEGNPFDLELLANIKLAPYPELTLKLNGLTSVNLKTKSFSLEKGALAINFANGATIRSTFNTQGSWAEPLTVTADIDANIVQLRALLGALTLPIPVTANADTLKILTLKSHIQLSGDTLAMTDTKIMLDQTSIAMAVKVAHFAKPRIEAGIVVDRINLDDYLPIPAVVDPNAPIPASVATPLPFEALQQLQAMLTLKVSQLTIKGIAVTNVDVGIKANSGLLTLKPAALKVADGQVNLNAQLDARASSGLLNGDFSVTSLQLASLLTQLKQPETLSGQLNAQATFKGQGATDEALINSLIADITADSPQIKLNSINVEKQFCEAVGLLKDGLEGRSQVANNAAWATYTELAPLKLKAHYEGKRLQLESLNADIQKLQASSYGEVDLATGDFKFPIDVRLAEFAGGLEGCASVDEKWRLRTVPLRCKGNLSNIGAKTCLPDSSRIADQLKAKVKEKVKEKLDENVDKVSAKAEEKAKEILQKNASEEDVKALKDSFKSLMNKR